MNRMMNMTTGLLSPVVKEKLAMVAGVMAYGILTFGLPIAVYMHYRPSPAQMSFFFLFFCLIALEGLGFFGALSFFRWTNSINDAFDELCYKIWISLRRAWKERNMKKAYSLVDY